MVEDENKARAQGWFEVRRQLVARAPAEDWDITLSDGPVVATAIHDGHAIRPSLQPLMALTDQQRLREEDPLTGLLTLVGDVRIRVPASRFEVDLSASAEQGRAVLRLVAFGPLVDDGLP